MKKVMAWGKVVKKKVPVYVSLGGLGALAEMLRQRMRAGGSGGSSSDPSVDIAGWKEEDYRRLARYEAARRADRAFDAEVGTQNASRHCFNWNVALDPIEFVDTVKVLFVPVGTALLGVVFIGLGVDLCDTVAGCALAPFAFFNAGMHLVASALSLKGARGFLRYRWRDITHCEEER